MVLFAGVTPSQAMAAKPANADMFAAMRIFHNDNTAFIARKPNNGLISQAFETTS